MTHAQLEAMAWRWGFWIRVFGYGKPSKGHEPLFSERYGYRTVYYTLWLRIEFLKQEK